MNQIDEKASRFLGKQTHNYDLSYTPDLLVPIERSINREAYGILYTDFMGYDVWHNYECSFLLDNGYPLTLVGKIRIPSYSKYFIESKSMKLYFFSMHMKKFGKTKSEAIKNYCETVRNDLSSKIGMEVEFNVFEDLSQCESFKQQFKPFDINIEKLNFDNYTESPSLLESDLSNPEERELNFIFKGFRSNCRVTHQPDFSNIYIHMKGSILPTQESLLRYLISFRNEFHFHEEVTEQIFKSLLRRFSFDNLFIANLFTRRGGIDICPVRYLKPIKENLTDTFTLTNPTVYQ